MLNFEEKREAAQKRLAPYSSDVSVDGLKELDAVWAKCDIGGRLIGIGFRGRKEKPDFLLSFKTEEEIKKHVTTWLDSIQLAKNQKAERASKRKVERAAAHGVKVGDIFRTSWGWEQTNVEFYQVVRVGVKSAVLREINCEMVEYSRKKPVKGEFVGEEFTRRISKNIVNGDPVNQSVKINDVATGTLTEDGKSYYFSTYA